MYVTAEQVKEYSTFPVVKERSDELLEMDILEAESYVEIKLKQPIEDFLPLKPKITLAIIKVAQFFALVNSDESITKGYKSEKLDDYSYTLADGTSLSIPNVMMLLNEFIDQPISDSNVFVRIRPL